MVSLKAEVRDGQVGPKFAEIIARPRRHRNNRTFADRTNTKLRSRQEYGDSVCATRDVSMAICRKRLFPLVAILAAAATRAAGTDELPNTYVLEYPVATQFVPPIEGFFEEVASTIGRAGRRTFRHQPNGGYGLAIREKVDGKHLVHLGADVGWYRVGDPVVSAAEGVVRLVQRPELKDGKRPKKPAAGMQWGGVVAVEHHLPDDAYVTTVYGHLGPKLLVSVGDLVRAGQPLGTIGNARVNGGYKPHLHFGVRDGRMAENGRVLLQANVNGQVATLRIRDVTEKVVTLDDVKGVPDTVKIFVRDKAFELKRKDGRFEVAADILWHLQPPEFAIVGYGLSTNGWRDPVAFLRDPEAPQE
jgi:murein DD-endopeptidase MepM/ murein hydrolase activator NlpD